MKRFVSALALMLALALCACGGRNADYSALIKACEKHAQKESFTASYRLNMTFEDGANTLLFSQGTYHAELGGGAPYVTVKASQNYLGTPSTVDAEYKDGVYSATGEAITKENFFGQLLFVQPFVPDSRFIKSAKAVSSGGGDGVIFELKNAYELLFPLIGEDIYDLARIYKPRRELTSISSAYITLIPASDGSAASMTVNFVLRVADTPPYVPGGGDAQDDYTLDIKTEYTVSFE